MKVVKETQQVSRAQKAFQLVPDQINYRVAHNKKKRVIWREAKKLQRQTVKKLINDQKGVQRIVKQARIADGKPKALLQFPPISRLGEEILYYNNKEKATILIEQFFPLPVEADLSDILGSIYPEPRTIKKEVDEEDIIIALKGLAPNKALGLKKITNYFLKTCGEQLVLVLAKLFSSYIAIGHYLKPFKDSIIVVLRKLQKPSYTTVKAYRPIALLNTIGKLLKRIVAGWLFKIAEETGMLLASQMGVRPGRLIQIALELLTQQVYIVWRSNLNLVVLLLSLNISRAFNRVSYKRIIYNIKAQAVPYWIVQFIKSFLKD